MKLILASQSPRRKELLEMLGLRPEILVPDTEEDCDRSAFSPDELVMGLACRKARAVFDMLCRAGRGEEALLILAADTVVALDGQILEKPVDEADAARMLRLLSGRRHQVYTGIAAIAADASNSRIAVDVQTTHVSFRPLTEEMISAYIATKEPMDKAGAYAVQQRGGLFVEGLDGDYFNVVGLPLVRVDEMLKASFGITLMQLQ